MAGEWERTVGTRAKSRSSSVRVSRCPENTSCTRQPTPQASTALRAAGERAREPA